MENRDEYGERRVKRRGMERKGENERGDKKRRGMERILKVLF